MFIFGLVVISVASLLIAAAPAAWWIIAARALQGVGAAIVAPSALSLLTASFEGEERDRAVAWYAATAGIGAGLGMLVGGAAATLLSWRAGFWINVPIGAAMIMLRWHLQQGRSALPKSVRPARIAENFDVFDFELTGAQLASIDALDTAVRRGPEPEDITLETFGHEIPEA